MSVLKDVIVYTEKVEGLNGIAEAFKKIDASENAIDYAAAASQLIAELAVATASTLALRTAFSGFRLGLAISGQIWKWEALTKLTGIGLGLTAGGVIDWVNDQNLGGKVYDLFEPHPDVNRDFNRGTSWTRPRDPLILDLDGDGIELTPSSAAVLFDHNADQIKTGSQWVKADDALLVRDLDGNGLIDSGRELFGDQTRIEVTRSYFDPNLVNANGTIGGMVTYTSTQTAANGFEALRPLDKDGSGASDGQIDASDVAYASLQVWQDLNQDGISQANELRTLAQAGISSIALNQQITVTDANGQTRQITQGAETSGVSSFTQTTASTDTQGNPVTTSTSQAIHNINLGSNAFYKEFVNNPAVSATAALLQQMRGAGLNVRFINKSYKPRSYRKRFKCHAQPIRHSNYQTQFRVALNCADRSTVSGIFL